MELNEVLAEQEIIINYVKEILAKIQATSNSKKKETYLYELLAFLISSSNDIAQKGDYYEAAGRLYSAAYYLEEYHLEEAQEIYQEANKYYIKYFEEKRKQGALNDASNLALKISMIYDNKLNNPEKKDQYLKMAISLIKEQIDILKTIGSSKELCSKYQTLGILYARFKNWENMIKTSQETLKYAKEIKDYSIIANSYHDIAIAYNKLSDPHESQNAFLRALDYFHKEVEIYQDEQKFLPLSQLYQIIKNIYDELKDWGNFSYYCRKEAGTYIELAEDALKKQKNLLQVASYYRGAALCYQDCGDNLVESASCFYIAGDYYLQAKKEFDAAVNYYDAGKKFSEIENHHKSYELFIKAGENYAKSRHYQEAIESFIWAFEISQDYGLESQKALNLLIKYLKTYAAKEAKELNFFVAGTLQLEAVRYNIKFVCDSKKENIDILNQAAQNYESFGDNSSEDCDYTHRYYAYALSCLLYHSIGKVKKTDSCKKKLESSTCPIANQYLILINTLMNSSDQNEMVFSHLDKKSADLYKKSPEMKKINEILSKIEG